jgi:hypothetical protein
MSAVVAVKKELRKKIKAILKDVSDSTAASQSMSMGDKFSTVQFS